MTSEITFIPPGYRRCVITDRLRKDTSEENVRQRVARSLIGEYGYSKEDIEVEFTIFVGGSRRRVDLAVFPPDTEHLPELISIIVECKRPELQPTDEANGVGQLKSYMAACLNCRFGMWVGKEMQVLEKTDDPREPYPIVSDIPRFGADSPAPYRYRDLVPAEEDDLASMFKRCHDYIFGNQGMQKEPAFHELLKIIFCKIQDERDLSNTLRFFIGNDERRSALGQTKLRTVIGQLFDDVKGRYPYIFPANANVELNNQTLAYIVGEFQRYSLQQTKADVKGVAYEQLVGSNLRGNRGEFFTPRTVCKLAAEMVLATFPKSHWLNINVLDPAVGTGGFLVALMNVWTDHIQALTRERYGEDDQRVYLETSSNLRDVASEHLFGIDFNPVLVQAAQMNLVMHGDGSTNVFHANSLLPRGEWPSADRNNVQGRIRLEYFDAILTNPPFGAYIPIDDPHILEQFDIGRHRGSVPPEQLFIERCVQLLRPGGRLAIILPDSILSNPGLRELRSWILAKTRVIASIDLPQETFEPHTTTHTSLLLLQKKPAEEVQVETEMGHPRAYEVFMSMPRAVGHDRRGKPLYRRSPEGHLLQREYSPPPVFLGAAGGKTIVERPATRQELIRNDDLPMVAQRFREWVSDPARWEWVNG